MEKFDGIKVYWDGTTLYSPLLKQKIVVPADCKFPIIPFEGELW
jgi:hypothetical protein